jgi:hypothetical protein
VNPERKRIAEKGQHVALVRSRVWAGLMTCLGLHLRKEFSRERSKVSCSRKAVCLLEFDERVVGLRAEEAGLLAGRAGTCQRDGESMLIEKLLERENIIAVISEAMVGGENETA